MGFYGGPGIIVVTQTIDSDTEVDTFDIKQGDTLPIIRRQLLDANGNAINLTGCTVRFLMGVPGGARRVEADAAIVSAALGTVEYEWESGDTSVVGSFRAEWEITYPDDKKLTVPTVRSQLVVKIHAQIA